LTPVVRRFRTASAGTGSTGATSRGAAADIGAGGSTGGSTAELIDLARIREFIGRPVRVGGLVSERTDDELWLDDGTATAQVLVTGVARASLAELRGGDAVEARGTVADGADGAYVLVDDPAGIVLAGAVVASAPAASNTEPAPATPSGIEAGLPAGQDKASGRIDAAAILALPSLAILLGLAAVAVVRRHRRRAAERVGQAVLARQLAAIPVAAGSQRPVSGTDEASHARPGTFASG
jgi:hypothetical protein